MSLISLRSFTLSLTTGAMKDRPV